MLLGVAPPVGVAALRKRPRQSSLATVANALMSEASVSKFASVVVQVLLPASTITFPHPPVSKFTRFGTFPAAMRSPSGLPEMASPLTNRAPVNAEATVVISLMTTLGGGVLPRTDNRAIAEFSPLLLLIVATPPLATK